MADLWDYKKIWQDEPDRVIFVSCYYNKTYKTVYNYLWVLNRLNIDSLMFDYQSEE